MLNAWARMGTGRGADAVTTAKTHADAVRPNVAAYTSVLNACAFPVGDAPEKREALRIAASTYGDLGADPDGYMARDPISTPTGPC